LVCSGNRLRLSIALRGTLSHPLIGLVHIHLHCAKKQAVIRDDSRGMLSERQSGCIRRNC
jgi:hypothetical protein